MPRQKSINKEEGKNVALPFSKCRTDYALSFHREKELQSRRKNSKNWNTFDNQLLLRTYPKGEDKKKNKRKKKEGT